MDDLLLYTHLACLAAAMVGIFLADKSALGWLRGRVETIAPQSVILAHQVVVAGLAGLVLSGLWLFWPMREYLLAQPLFLLKMGFVAALILNSFFIELLMPVAQTRAYASLSGREKLPLMLSGAVSTLSWLGAATAAIILFGWPF